MLNFLSKLLGTHVEKGKNTIVETLIKMDPKSASEAEIKVMEENLDKITKELAGANVDMNREKAEYIAAKQLHEQRLQAADKLESMIANSSSNEEKTRNEEALAKLMDIIEEGYETLQREKTEFEESQAMYNQLDEIVKELANNLKVARSNLNKAERELKSASIEKENAERLQERAKVVAGIKKDTSSNNIALTKMKEMAAIERAHAAEIKKNTGIFSNASTQDSVIDSVMESVKKGDSNTSGTLSERLAKFRS